MKSYFLNNYKLTNFEVVKSLVVSEYGLRHLELAKTQKENQWGHRVIAFIELCPIIGLIASIIEAIFAKCFNFFSQMSNTWIFNGTQYGASGPVSISKVEAIRDKLDNQSELGIQFNKNNVKDQIEGGTCSAMAFEFLDTYFKLKKSASFQSFETKKLKNRFKEAGKKFATSSEEMRVRQAAFNTIVVKQSETSETNVDLSKNKIQSILNYHGYKIDYASEEMDVTTLTSSSDLHPKMEKMPEGVYVIRILKPADNEKLEEHGHTSIYVKEKKFGLFYDSNKGLRKLSKLRHGSILFESFKDCFETWQVHKARFYRIQPPTLAPEKTKRHV